MSNKHFLLESIAGQRFVLPNLLDIFAGWPVATHSALDELRTLVDQHLDNRYSTDILPPKTARAFQKNDFGLFAATWWPLASLERLCVVAALFIWIYAWDDELDSASGMLVDSAQNFLSETASYVRRSLDDNVSLLEKPNNALIERFDWIGVVLKRRYSIAQRHTLVKHMSHFIQQSLAEQKMILSQDIPELAAYWRMRLGTSAIDVTTAMLEYAYDIELPAMIAQSAELQQLYLLTNEIISLTNDMISAKKEVVSCSSTTTSTSADPKCQQNGTVHNALIILFSMTGDADLSVQLAMEWLKGMLVAFDVAAFRLLDSASGLTANEKASIEKIVQGCRYQCTGNVTWSLVTPRYGLEGDDAGNIVLQF
ncbi:hypothetical protein LTR97_004340 [Elasticomyces elasticus]|uniref:Terpene synthase n=1 Tax=Elasticomyces elasticus TaxID=574655 RepID=A0AAN7W8G2_9PEZI|nr:hypothetical protein LTR97_004340 [Elasticomyces elasticus]